MNLQDIKILILKPQMSAVFSANSLLQFDFAVNLSLLMND